LGFCFCFYAPERPRKYAKGKYPIDSLNVYATITDDPSKDFEKTNWESHRKYIDLQYIITGEEIIGISPVSQSTVTKEYDEKKDVANYSTGGKMEQSVPGTFFLFFPTDAHRPNITPGGNKPVKKLVIKIRYGLICLRRHYLKIIKVLICAICGLSILH
jgi:biofilm protein TabA